MRLFRSQAHYFDKRGPISWDMAMTATPADWRPQVKAGDVLRISTTYDTTRASWYESMGIMVVWEAWNGQSGVDPFTHRLDERGHITHGHLAEDNDHGGAYSLGVNPMTFPSCCRRRWRSRASCSTRVTSAPPAPSAASRPSSRASR